MEQPNPSQTVLPRKLVSPAARKPSWLRGSQPLEGYPVRQLLKDLQLNTICEEARCPNIGQCFKQRTATFLLMGRACTRNCRFCRVRAEAPEPLDPLEGARVAEAVERLGLRYVVLTSVTRDDLPDGGAAHVCSVVEAIRKRHPGTHIELLISDLGGDADALRAVVGCKPDVLGHNLETVPRLYPAIRSDADYRRSLEVLRQAKALDRRLATKSALMLGLGEQDAEVRAVMRDLRAADCDLLVLGQYLQPTRTHAPVREYVAPEQFEHLEQEALAMGFAGALCRPLARSSYLAQEMFEALSDRRRPCKEAAPAPERTAQPNPTGQSKECLACFLKQCEYEPVWRLQRRLQTARIAGTIPDLLLFVEHAPVYTLGKSGDLAHLLVDPKGLKEQGAAFHRVDRGGGITYHGPGQLVGYLVMDLHSWGVSVRRFVRSVEEVLMRALSDFGVRSARKDGYPGLWVGERKIASIGLEVRRWVTMHGFALNVHTDLTRFDAVVPCGLKGVRMTSIARECGEVIGLEPVAARVVYHTQDVLDRQITEVSTDRLEDLLRCVP